MDVHGGVVTEFDVAGDVLVELEAPVLRYTRPCRKLWIRRWEKKPPCFYNEATNILKAKMLPFVEQRETTP